MLAEMPIRADFATIFADSRTTVDFRPAKSPAATGYAAHPAQGFEFVATPL